MRQVYIEGTLVVPLLGSRIAIDSNAWFLYSALFHPVDSSCFILDGPIESNSPIERVGLSGLYDKLTLLVYTVTGQNGTDYASPKSQAELRGY